MFLNRIKTNDLKVNDFLLCLLYIKAIAVVMLMLKLYLYKDILV